MQFEARMRFQGFVRWQVLDEDGNPEVAVDPDGNEIESGHWQPNLITDRGLDLLNSYQFIEQDVGQGGWRDYLGVGTGATAPSTSDTQLVAETDRSNSDGGFSPTEVITIDDKGTTGTTTDDELKMELTQTRIVTLAADQNLTEYGFTPTNTTTDYVVRELFRDGVGTPITISVKAGKKIRVDHKLIVTLPYSTAGLTVEANIAEYDVNDTITPKVTAATNATPIQITTDVAHGLATGNKVVIQNVGGNTAANGTWVITKVDDTNFTLDTSVGNGAYTSGGEVIRRYVFTAGTWVSDNTKSARLRHPFLLFNPYTLFGVGTGKMTPLNSGAVFDRNNDPLSDNEEYALSAEPYVQGTFEVVKYYTFTESQNNEPHYGWMIWWKDLSGTTPNSAGGFAAILTNPTSISKSNTQTLKISFKSSWARA